MKIKKGVFILVLCFLSVHFVFGQNLVNNGDFELSICPTGLSQITKADYWSSPSDGTPDLYKDCTIFGVDVPRNSQGWQLPLSGNTYAGIISFAAGGSREYIQNELSDSLINGQKYVISFFASLSNNSQYSNNSLGVLLTTDKLNLNISGGNINMIPQYENSTISLNDTLNWVLLSDTFTANGGEKFLSIGCFRPDSTADTMSVAPSGIFGFYYIENVSLYRDSVTNIDESENKFAISVYPNPVTSNLFFLKNTTKPFEILIIDVYGRIIYTFKSYTQNSIDLSSLERGTYFIQFDFGSIIINEKIVKLAP
jgi:hypothetical protein